MSEAWREGEWTGDELAFVAALAGLPLLGFDRLGWLLSLEHRPSHVWRRIAEKRLAAEVPASREKRDLRASLALLVQLAARKARRSASSQIQI